MQALLHETISVLGAAGAECVAFDKSLDEIRRILLMYESKLATEAARKTLRQVPMARYFLTRHYAPSDVRQMSALLEQDVSDAGLHIIPTPKRVTEHVALESALAMRLADPHTGDDMEPRVQHDVDCVAAILTLRRGHTSASIEEARAVFATSAPLVIRNTKAWYEQDERGGGVEPVVHISALVNLAWLKKPALSAELSERQLIALCAVALRPKRETWHRFIRHLGRLEQSERLTSDEATAIVASALSDHLLREAEANADGDIDAETLDDVVVRVKASYSAEAERQLGALRSEYEAKLHAALQQGEDAAKRADAATEDARRVEAVAEARKREIVEFAARDQTASQLAEVARRRDLHIQKRARSIARICGAVIQVVLSLIVCGGAVALITGHPLHTGVLGLLLGLSVVAFVVLELVGILGHVRLWRLEIEARVSTRVRRWLGGE